MIVRKTQMLARVDLIFAGGRDFRVFNILCISILKWY